MLYIYIKTHSGCLFSSCSADLIGQNLKGKRASTSFFQGLPGPSPPHCTSPPRGYSEPGTRGCPGPRHTGERPGPHPPFLSSVKHFYTTGGVRIQNKFTSWVSYTSFHFLLLGTKRVGREGLRAQTLRKKPVNLPRLNLRGRKFKDSQRLPIFILQCRPNWSKSKRKTCINIILSGPPWPESPPLYLATPRIQ